MTSIAVNPPAPPAFLISSLTTSGYYVDEGGTQPADLPGSVTETAGAWAVLVEVPDNSDNCPIIRQTCIIAANSTYTHGAYFIRYRLPAGTWTSWQQVPA